MFSLPHLFFPPIHRIATCAHKSIYVMKYTCKMVGMWLHRAAYKVYMQWTWTSAGCTVQVYVVGVGSWRQDWLRRLFTFYALHPASHSTQHNMLQHTAQRYTQALQVHIIPTNTTCNITRGNITREFLCSTAPQQTLYNTPWATNTNKLAQYKTLPHVANNMFILPLLHCCITTNFVFYLTSYHGLYCFTLSHDMSFTEHQVVQTKDKISFKKWNRKKWQILSFGIECNSDTCYFKSYEYCPCYTDSVDRWHWYQRVEYSTLHQIAHLTQLGRVLVSTWESWGWPIDFLPSAHHQNIISSLLNIINSSQSEK